MGNNVHFLAVDIATLEREDIAPEDFLAADGLTWCGETWERSWAYHDQLDTIIAPLLSPHVRQVISGEVQSFSHPLVDLLRESGAEVTPMTPREVAAVRTAARTAIATADWGSYDDYEWRAFAESDVTGDFFVIVEFV